MSGDGRDRFERWVGAGLAAASFAALLQFASLNSPPPSGSALRGAAWCFAAALPLALLGMFLSLVQTGRFVSQLMHARWSRRIEACAGFAVIAAGVAAASGAALLSSHAVAPGGGYWSWPTWLFLACFLGIFIVILVLEVGQRLDRRNELRRRSR